MPQYMLLSYRPSSGYEPSQETVAEEHKQWVQYSKDLTDAGALVSNVGLAGPEAATTVRVREGETQITDGPFAETKELLAGTFLIQAEDLDAALKWAARMPSSTYGSVEVRPVWG